LTDKKANKWRIIGRSEKTQSGLCNSRIFPFPDFPTYLPQELKVFPLPGVGNKARSVPPAKIRDFFPSFLKISLFFRYLSRPKTPDAQGCPKVVQENLISGTFVVDLVPLLG
jgi:hypothetical protein